MEKLIWFGISETHNCVKMRSVDPTIIIHYIKNKYYKIINIEIEENSKFKNLKEENTDNWQLCNYQNIQHFLDIIDWKKILCIEIKLKNNQIINFMYGQLIVKLNCMKELKKITTKILEIYGYFKADLIWEFCIKNEDEFLIEIAQGMEKNNLSNEFKQMIEHNIEIEKSNKDIYKKI